MAHRPTSSPTQPVDGPAGEPEPHVLELIERLGRLIRSARRREVELDPVHWEALRYFSRANRYSRNPGALARYLAATKGTTSQTIRALERHGYLARERSTQDRRSIRLGLTAGGRRLLLRDPLIAMLARARGARTLRLAEDLEALLVELQRANRNRSFGVCATCRFFRRDAMASDADGGHRCGLTGERLSDEDASLICAEHEIAPARPPAEA